MDSLGGNQLKRLKEEARLQDLAAGWILAILSGLTLFALTAQWPEFTHDDITHLRRIEALTDAFRAGVIFPRWFPDLMFGYGAPVLNYYPFGSYYPPALLHVAGLDLLMSVRVAFSLGFAYQHCGCIDLVGSTFRCGRRWSVSSAFSSSRIAFTICL